MKSRRVGPDCIFTGAPPLHPTLWEKYGLAHKTSHVPKQNGTYCSHTLKTLKCRLYFYSKLNYFVLGICSADWWIDVSTVNCLYYDTRLVEERKKLRGKQ